MSSGCGDDRWGLRATFLATNLITIFVVSGALALGYQVLWSKYILAFMGVSAYSYATVLAAFMGGLSIGAWYFGKRVDLARRPLLVFALLELGIGLYALLFPSLNLGATSLYGLIVDASPDQWGANLSAKAIMAALLLLPPTFLMGGTFPAMVRYATETVGLVRRRVATLYAVNAFGAVIGSLSMALLLLPALGMARSLWLLAVGNMMVAGWAMLLGRAGTIPLDSLASRRGEEEGERETQPILPESILKRRLLWISALAFAAGALAFTYEIAWTRYFAIVLGSSTHSFAVMLASFIAGIGIGCLLLARRGRPAGEAILTFGWTQLVAAALVVLTLPMYPRIPWLMHRLSGLFSDEIGAFYLDLGAKLLVSFVLMLPATIFLGMSLPLLVDGMVRKLDLLGTQTGRVYACNTFGNVCGSLLTGLLLLPLVGMEQLLRLAAMGNAALALGAFLRFSPTVEEDRNSRTRLAIAATVALAIALGATSIGHWDARWLTLRAFRRGGESVDLVSTQARLEEREILFMRDDPAGNLIVERQMYAMDQIAILVNGKPDASSYWDMPTQVLAAQVPLLFHQEPRDVLVVGLASGVTAGAALTHPIERLDVVELLRAMPTASRYFVAFNGDPYSDQRFNLVLDDARSYLTHTRQRYDVVISEPSNPWMAGVAPLFTVESFQRVRQVLRQNGIFVQWLQIYSISDDAFAAVVGSLADVFPFVYAFQGCHSDLLLISSSQPIMPDWTVMENRLQQPNVQLQLQSLGIFSVHDLLMLQVFSPGTVEAISHMSDVRNTDDNLWLEHRAPIDLFRFQSAILPEILDQRLGPGTGLMLQDYRTTCSVPLSAISSLGLMTDPRIRRDSLTGTLCIAKQHLERLDPDLTSTFDWPGMPDACVLPLALSPDEISAAVEDRLRPSDLARAADVLARYHRAIVIECRESAAARDYWLPRLDEWWQRAAGAAPAAEMRALWIDVLLASGQEQAAREELQQWLHGPRPPEALWALSRMCSLDRGESCTQTAQLYRLSSSSRMPAM